MIKKKLISRKVAMIFLTFLVLSLTMVVIIKITQPPKKVNVSFTQTKVKAGNIKIAVVANGTVSSTTSMDISSQINGTLKMLNYKEGDRVKKGDILATIQDDTLTEDITRAENNLKQQKLSLTKLNESLSSLSIKSPAGGRIKTLKARVGEDIVVTNKAYGALAVISTDGKMKVMMVPVQGVTVSTGDTVDVILSDDTVIEGTIVTPVDSQTSAQGSLQIEITQDDLTIGENVTVEKSNGTEIGQGVLELNKGISVTGENGIISVIYVKENQKVTRGKTLFTIDNSDAKSNIENQNISVQQAQNDLNSKKALLKDTSIISPLDGVIVTQGVKIGDTLQQGKVVATIMDLSQMQVVVTVDELDIAKVKISQKAKITLDALPDKVFTGKVTKINDIGIASNGVTTYDVAVLIDKQDQIKVGMSSNASIEVASKDKVLILPIEALQGSGNKRFVFVQAPTASPSNTFKLSNKQPSGETTQIKKSVTVGLMNENEVEILSGIKENDTVLIPVKISQNTSQQSMFGGGGAGQGRLQETPAQSGNRQNSSPAPVSSSKPN